MSLRIERCNTSRKPHTTHTILKDIQLKNSLFKNFSISNTPEDSAQHKTVRNRVNSLIKRSRTKYFRKHFVHCTSYKAVWRTISSLIGRLKQHHTRYLSSTTLARSFAQVSSAKLSPDFPLIHSFLPQPPVSNSSL